MRRLGAGGFATVWLYHDDELDAPVAVKALADNWAQRTDVRDRFLDEARMLRRADSDHLVRIYDIGEVDQTPYFVMSYADRGSIANVIDEGPVPVDRAVSLVLQACAGVGVLHRRGIIHRDIKPHNLLLDTADDGSERVLVADLGVAKAMLHSSGLTEVVGTPAYMAPEQAFGGAVDPRADIHALGAVAYRMITGQPVRSGGLADLTSLQLPSPPSTYGREFAPYDEVLLKALAPKPADRWPDVESFAHALETAHLAAMGSTVQLQAPRARRRTGRIAVAVVAAVAAVGAGVGIYALAGTGGDQRASGSTSPSASPTYTVVPDVSYPALGPVKLTVRHRVVAANGSVWSYLVPAGWTPEDPHTTLTIPAAQVDKRASIVWRPPHPPAIGGYLLRFDALTATQTPQDLRQQLIMNLQAPTTVNVHNLTVLANRPDNGLWFTYIDGVGHLRYNFFRWLSVPSGLAGLQASVAGRQSDVTGLESLLDAVMATAYPVN